jgi:bifunctional DNA-binding transcriptional regulator/antitoxin component of YhaV-PrlF toxin-antitoxin module
MQGRDEEHAGGAATAPGPARPQRLRLDSRGRVLLPPPLRAAAGLAPGQPLRIAVEDDEVRVAPLDPGRAAARAPTLDRKGRLTLPGPLRAALGLGVGATLLLQPVPPGLRLVTPARLIGRLREARLALARHLGG